LQKRELRVSQQMLDIPFSSGQQIVETDDIVSFGNEPITEMRAQEAGAASDECSRPLRWFV
jgi:hypothetical protein